MTDITQAEGSQEGITQGVDQHIGIRMADGTFIGRNVNTAQPERFSFSKAVYVKSGSYPKCHLVSGRDVLILLGEGIEVKQQGETQGILQWVALIHSHKVGEIHPEDIVF